MEVRNATKEEAAKINVKVTISGMDSVEGLVDGVQEVEGSSIVGILLTENAENMETKILIGGPFSLQSIAAAIEGLGKLRAMMVEQSVGMLLNAHKCTCGKCGKE